MDEDSQRHEVCAIEQVPGLYITDWVGASSVNEVNILNITHILTVLSAAELDQYGPDETEGVNLRHLNLRDEASEDIIQYFGQECDWLDEVLHGGNVLVHCQQGVSRSVAIVVAYLMRKLQTSFSNALKMVKKSRDIVNINAAFQEQLKVWEQCHFDIFERASNGKKKEKPAYIAWKRKHGPKIDSNIGKFEEEELKSATTLSPKTPVQEVEAQNLIDFLENRE